MFRRTCLLVAVAFASLASFSQEKQPGHFFPGEKWPDNNGEHINAHGGRHNEAPALFKKEGKYYMVTSGCTGWAPNAARSAVATHIFGPWKELGNPCAGEGAELTFNSQSTFILPVPGNENLWIVTADRWNPKNPIDGGYVWLPLLLENGKPVIRWKDDWQMDSPK